MTQNNGCKTKIRLSDVYKMRYIYLDKKDEGHLRVKGWKKDSQTNGPENQAVIVI